MADEKEKELNKPGEKPSEESLRGRTHNSQNPAFEKTESGGDISSIDQQEGNMNHGESGDMGGQEKVG